MVAACARELAAALVNRVDQVSECTLSQSITLNLQHAIDLGNR